MNNLLTREQVIDLVDGVGPLKFTRWYKNTMTYVNDRFIVKFQPDYRDELVAEDPLAYVIDCEYVTIYDKINDIHVEFYNE